MNLSHVQKTFERFGANDPFYAVLSDKSRQQDRWDRKEFYQTGEVEIREVLARVARLGCGLKTGRALDFGSGVGRLSEALGDRFQNVVGVDISSSMIAKAEEHNRHGARCTYILNTRDNLALLPDNDFDFVYSNITLQHIPPRYSCRYIREFFRVLRPGGVVVFQLPTGEICRPGTLRGIGYSMRREYLRPWWKKMRGKPTVQIHYVAQELVEEHIGAGGGRVLAIEGNDAPRTFWKRFRRGWKSLVYYATKP